MRREIPKLRYIVSKLPPLPEKDEKKTGYDCRFVSRGFLC